MVRLRYQVTLTNMSKRIIINPGVLNIKIAGARVPAKILPAKTLQAEKKESVPEVKQKPIDLDQIRKQAVEETEKRLKKEYEKELYEVEEKWRLRWASLEKGTKQFSEDLEKELREQLVESSLKMAEVIIRSHLPNVEMIKTVIEQILEPLPELEGLSVCLHPEDAKCFKALQEQALSRPLNQIVIEADSSLSLGDVMVQSRSGYFNGQISQRLALLADTLKERMYKDDRAPST